MYMCVRISYTHAIGIYKYASIDKQVVIEISSIIKVGSLGM